MKGTLGSVPSIKKIKTVYQTIYVFTLHSLKGLQDVRLRFFQPSHVSHDQYLYSIKYIYRFPSCEHKFLSISLTCYVLEIQVHFSGQNVYQVEVTLKCSIT